MRYQFIQAERANYPAALLCQCLQVAKSGFYAWLKRSPSRRDQANQTLKKNIVLIHQQSRCTYGSPRVFAKLRQQGLHIGRKRVERLLKEAGICVKPKKRFVKTTDSQHAFPVASNLLKQQFVVPQKDQAWVSDITYLNTEEGFLYLCVILDLYSRRVVGWATRTTLDRNLVLAAVYQAKWVRKPGPGLLHHSDRGCQYASEEVQKVFVEAQITCSMSRRGNCYDNAVAESFFATLKGELIHRQKWVTHHQVEIALFEYIEGFYNRQRLHSSLDYQSPVEYEQKTS